MVDPEINQMGEGNTALNKLKKFEAERNIFIETCANVMGLKMAANPKTGASAYFSAAIKSGYTKIQIQHKQGWNQWVFYPSKQTSEIQTFRNTVEWQKGYEANTGHIKDNEAPGGEYKLTENDNWYFYNPNVK